MSIFKDLPRWFVEVHDDVLNVMSEPYESLATVYDEYIGVKTDASRMWIAGLMVYNSAVDIPNGRQYAWRFVAKATLVNRRTRSVSLTLTGEPSSTLSKAGVDVTPLTFSETFLYKFNTTPASTAARERVRLDVVHLLDPAMDTFKGLRFVADMDKAVPDA